MLLLTLPSWALGLLIACFVVSVVVRRLQAVRGYPVFVALTVLVLVVQGTPFPHVAWAFAWYLNPDARPALEDLDFRLSAAQREEVVQRAAAGELEQAPGEYAGPEDLLLPDGFGGLAISDTVWVSKDVCGTRVFFMTITGFSPDPYGGFEYSTPGCVPELDPLGSGQGRARDLGGGWYWIDAS